MMGQSRAECEIHSSGFPPVRSAPLLGSATFDPRLGATGFDWRRVLSGKTLSTSSS
jgi:hypothetical protein